MDERKLYFGVSKSHHVYCPGDRLAMRRRKEKLASSIVGDVVTEGALVSCWNHGASAMCRSAGAISRARFKMMSRMAPATRHAWQPRYPQPVSDRGADAERCGRRYRHRPGAGGWAGADSRLPASVRAERGGHRPGRRHNHGGWADLRLLSCRPRLPARPNHRAANGVTIAAVSSASPWPASLPLACGQGEATHFETLKRNSMMSPSRTTYSLPSRRTWPCSFAVFIEPLSRIRSS